VVLALREVRGSASEEGDEMSRKSRLAEYLDRRQAGPGWRKSYDAKVTEAYEHGSTGYLTGWYQGMLDELIDIIGTERAIALVELDDKARGL
jgi:hypothetical protein